MKYRDLSPSAKQLLKINFIYGIASIIANTFVYAYLWEKVEALPMFLVYHLVMFTALPLGFYLNGLLLKKFNIIKLHVLGVLFEILSVAFLMYTQTLTVAHMIFAGFATAMGLSLYWANRVYFSQLGVKNDERDRFNSLGAALQILPNVVLPVIIGYLLVAGENSGLYSKDLAYKLLGLSAIAVACILYLNARKINIQNPKIKIFFVKKKSKFYNQFKLFIFTQGIKGGVMFFIPSILILNYVGKEDVFGTMISASSILAAITIYFIGKKIPADKRTYARTVSIILQTILAAYIFIHPSLSSVMAYIILSALVAPISTSIFFTLHQLSINKLKDDDNDIYPYILATEIYLNSGRILGLGILLGLYYFLGETIALQSILVIVLLLWVMSVGVVERINRAVAV